MTAARSAQRLSTFNDEVRFLEASALSKFWYGEARRVRDEDYQRCKTDDERLGIFYKFSKACEEAKFYHYLASQKRHSIIKTWVKSRSASNEPERLMGRDREIALSKASDAVSKVKKLAASLTQGIYLGETR